MKWNKGYRLVSLLVIGIVLLVGVRFFPYFFSSVPLGYDPGLYRAFFLEYFHHIPVFDYTTLSMWIKGMYEPFLGYLGVILQMIGYSVDALLTWGLAFFSVITSVFIYLVLKKYSKTCAILGVVLFLLSIVQYKAFRWHYYKQIIGIIFVLGSFYLIEKKQYTLLIPLLIGAFAVQRPTGVFLLLTILAYIVGTYISKKQVSKGLIISLAIGGIGAFILYIPFLNELILPLLKPLLGSAFIDGTSGTFFTKDLFVWYSLPYICLATYGFYLRVRDKSFDIIDAGFIIGVLRIGLQLFFYNRMLIFTDLMFILMSARALEKLLLRKKGWIYIGLILIYQIVQYGIYVYNNHRPLVSESEFSFLNNLHSMLPANSTMMVTHKNYSPRVIGYTLRPTIAPGLLDWNPWTLNQWIKRRKGNGEVKCQMLHQTYSGMDTPLYLWLGERQPPENLSSGNCFHLLYASGHYALFTINLNNNVE